jgi:hypothetical protein
MSHRCLKVDSNIFDVSLKTAESPGLISGEGQVRCGCWDRQQATISKLQLSAKAPLIFFACTRTVVGSEFASRLRGSYDRATRSDSAAG